MSRSFVVAAAALALPVFALMAGAEEREIHVEKRVHRGGSCSWSGHGPWKGHGKGYGFGARAEKRGKKKLGEKVLMKMKFLLRKADRLGLSEKQVESLEALKAETKKKKIEAKARMEVLSIDLWQALKKNPVDTAKADALLDEKFGTKKTFAKAMVRALARTKEIVGAETWKKAMKMKKGKKGRKGKKKRR